MIGYEDVQCPQCGRIGQNMIEQEQETKWLICKCGECLQEVTE